MNELTTKPGEITVRTALVTRTWRSEPDGPNDRPVDIWYNGNWIPAFFSDIRRGDFYLDLKINLDPDRCFYAASDCIRCGTASGNPSFAIIRGSEIVQAPAIKDSATLIEGHSTLLLKEL